jgi:hypothetical protein
MEDGDVQELHSLSQDLGSEASAAALGCSVTTELDEPSCSHQFSKSERFFKRWFSSTNQNQQGHMKTKSKITNYIVHSIVAAVLVLTAQISLAGSATWLLSPAGFSLGKRQQLDAGWAAERAIRCRNVRSVLADKRGHLDLSRGEQHRVHRRLRFFQFVDLIHVISARRPDY